MCGFWSIPVNNWIILGAIIVFTKWFCFKRFLKISELLNIISLLATKIQLGDWEELKSIFNSKTKVIIINTPNNPTGKIFSENELKIVADLCEDFNVTAITDEIYEYIDEKKLNSHTVEEIMKNFESTGKNFDKKIAWEILLIKKLFTLDIIFPD